MWTNGFGCVCARERNKRSSKRAWKTPRALHLDVSVFFLWVNWGRANIFLYILLFYNEFVIISNSRRFFPHSHFLHCMFPHIFRFHISFSVTTGEREREQENWWQPMRWKTRARFQFRKRERKCTRCGASTRTEKKNAMETYCEAKEREGGGSEEKTRSRILFQCLFISRDRT